jgi:RNA-dependent RNA polymerase
MVAINWLIIADQSDLGIFDPDCLTLADLHSDAVDYQKSGQPVLTDKVPKLKSRKRPDWNAPETVAGNSDKYYESQRAIGKLFRDIDLPIVRTPRVDVRSIYNKEPEVDALLSELSLDGDENDPLYRALENRVSGFLPEEPTPTAQTSQMFGRYSNELLNICATHTLSYSKNAMLSEEEVIIGTIVAKSSQPRRRKDLMSKMREQTDLLVRGIREELAGEEGSSHEDALGRAWVCWKFSVAYHKRFGAKSFGWIALGAIFEAIKAIEDAERDFY